MGKKLATTAAIVIVVMWIVHNPAGAAAAVHNFIHAVSAFADAL